jgi:hypothetical protein
VWDESGTHSVSGRDIHEVSSMENSTLSARKLQLETVPTYNEQRLVRSGLLQSKTNIQHKPLYSVFLVSSYYFLTVLLTKLFSS